jgi:peptidoglycan hydrolase-like protein with peptidoglycan-binding domain
VSSADKSVFVGKSSTNRQPVKANFSESFLVLVTGISLASCCRMQIHEETIMAKFLSIVLSVFLLSACATVNEDNDSQVAGTQALPGSEIQSVESTAPTSAEPARNELAAGAKKIPSKQEIKLIQAQLKASGFDPGPVDGALGAKTISALRRLQSGCANLKDLFENSTSGISQQVGERQATNQIATNRFASVDDIRLIQVRLKDAGFDVGPVDGVMGSKTKSALIRFQSGCTMVKEWSATLENQVQTSDRTPSPMPGSEKQLQPAPSKASPAIESVRDEAGKRNSAADRSPSREEIRLIQAQLKAAGFDPGPFDGMLGPKTKSALQQYRTVYGSANSPKLSSSVGLKSDY